jgi:hypothetical protein
MSISVKIVYYIISDRNASLYKSENFAVECACARVGTSHEFHNGISITCDIRRFIFQVQLLQKIQEMKFHSSKMTAVKFSNL